MSDRDVGVSRITAAAGRDVLVMVMATVQRFTGDRLGGVGGHPTTAVVKRRRRKSRVRLPLLPAAHGIDGRALPIANSPPIYHLRRLLHFGRLFVRRRWAQQLAAAAARGASGTAAV